MPVDIETEVERLRRGGKRKNAATLVIETCGTGVLGFLATIQRRARDIGLFGERVGRNVEH